MYGLYLVAHFQVFCTFTLREVFASASEAAAILYSDGACCRRALDDPDDHAVYLPPSLSFLVCWVFFKWKTEITEVERMWLFFVHRTGDHLSFSSSDWL